MCQWMGGLSQEELLHKQRCCAVLNCGPVCCLQVDVDLVSSVGEEVYVALDKGPINPQHALIIPIEHHPSLAALPPAPAQEVGK